VISNHRLTVSSCCASLPTHIVTPLCPRWFESCPNHTAGWHPILADRDSGVVANRRTNLTEGVTKDGACLKPRDRTQRQLLILAPIAAVLVWLIVASYFDRAIQVVGLVLGIPVIIVLLVIALRPYKNSK